MQTRLWQRDHDCILYDAEQLQDPATALFDPDWWDARGLRLSTFHGRGSVAVVRHHDACWVLRRFRRGGLVGRLVDHSYVWTGLRRTRPWREWLLLAALHEQGLPVPRPVAAHVHRELWRYSGNIISELVPEAEPVAGLLQRRPLSIEDWSRLGATVKRFHAAGVHHPDLNAANILLDPSGRFFLVDFDRGRLHAPPALLATDIARLRRSLDKYRATRAAFHFDDACWQAFSLGYAA